MATEIDGDLPRGWALTTLGELVLPGKERFDPTTVGEDLTYIGLEHIEKDTGRILGHGRSTEVKSTKAVFHAGDVLYGKLRPYLNKVAIPEFDGVCSTDILVFPRGNHIESKFLYYRLLNSDFVRFANENVSGVQHPRTDFRSLSRFRIALPPLAEQRRIVAKIDALMGKDIIAIDNLEQARLFVNRMKQAIVWKALEGELTKNWRTKNKTGYPSENISSANVDVSNDPNMGLNSLPNGWESKQINEVFERVTVGFVGKMKDEYRESGVPFLRSQNVRENHFSLDGLVRISPEFDKKLSKSRVRPGDVVVVRSGVNIGMCCVIPNEIKEANCSDLVILQRPKNVDPHFVSYFINSFGKRHVEMNHVGNAQPHYNTKTVTILPILIPPLDEQKQIVNVIKKGIDGAEKIVEEINRSLTLARAVKERVLIDAFEGKLVPQDPNDEPASKLLESIKSEKTKGKSRQARIT